MQFAFTFGVFVPAFYLIVNGVKMTETIHKSLPEILFSILLYRCALPQSKLPVVNAFVIGVPVQSPALHTVFFCQLVQLQRTFIHCLITVFVHILSFNNRMSSVVCKLFKQHFKLRRIIGAGRCSKSSVHQIMRNIRFNETFRNIDNTGIGISDKVYRTSGRSAFGLAGRGKPDILGS